jgi:hypothetical protein
VLWSWFEDKARDEMVVLFSVMLGSFVLEVVCRSGMLVLLQMQGFCLFTCACATTALRHHSHSRHHHHEGIMNVNMNSASSVSTKMYIVEFLLLILLFRV